MSRSERIALQLGMSHGAAANKLRKIILFSLLKKLKENICFKCSKDIVSEIDLSIEHKKPWEGLDASLFWDLDNISFSHIDCNRPHRYGRWQLTDEEKRKDTQNRKNIWERNNYTPDKRKERYLTTGN